MKRIIFAALLLLVVLTGCRQQPSGYSLHTDYLPVQLAGSEKWSILNVNTGEVLARDAFATAPSAVVSDMFMIVNDDGTCDYYNIADPTHRVNTESYGSATVFGDNGLAVASLRGGPLLVIDTKCQVVRELPRNVAQCTMFNHNRAAYQTDDGLWGYIDQRGDTVIPARYASANAFLHGDLAVVVDATQSADTAVSYTIIDAAGRERFHATTARYGIIQPYYVSGVLPVVDGDSIVCLDGDGHEVPNPNDNHHAVDNAHYTDYTRTAAGFFIVNDGKHVGLVDHDNKVLIAPQWDRIIDVTPDRYIAMTDTVCHLVDRQGKAVGSAQFVHVHGSVDATMAVRGSIDVSTAAAAMLMLITPTECCGASASTTLMDMNQALTGSPDDYVGINTLTAQQGPFVVQYVFDRCLAASPTAGAPAGLDYGARVVASNITLNVGHCALKTEAELVDKMSSALGTRGFVFEGNGIFVSEAGTAVTLGYDSGLVRLYYFMHSADAKPLPQNPRH